MEEQQELHLDAMLEKIRDDAVKIFTDTKKQENLIRLEDAVDIAKTIFGARTTAVTVKSHDIAIAAYTAAERDLFVDFIMGCVGSTYEELSLVCLVHVTYTDKPYVISLKGRVP